MSFSSHLKKRLTEFLKRLVSLHSEKSILQIEREVRNLRRERAAARFPAVTFRRIVQQGISSGETESRCLAAATLVVAT